jgi:DNA-binding transcriptional LysR family regulator
LRLAVGLGIIATDFIMDLRHLRSFVAVAEELSFRRAAERLHLSQPPLSRQIKALEEELGVRLLERDRGSRVSLTDAGKSFLADARLALSTATAARGRAQNAARDARVQLKLGNIAKLSIRLLQHLLPAYREQFPQVGVSLFEMNRPKQLTALREGRIHAGIFPDLGAPLDREFQSMPPKFTDCVARNCTWLRRTIKRPLRGHEFHTHYNPNGGRDGEPPWHGRRWLWSGYLAGGRCDFVC